MRLSSALHAIELRACSKVNSEVSLDRTNSGNIKFYWRYHSIMSKEIIAKLNDEELEAVCGGGAKDELEKGFFGEMGKFGFAIIAVPVTAMLSTLAVWGTKLLTEKLDKKIAESKANQPIAPTAAVEAQK